MDTKNKKEVAVKLLQEFFTKGTTEKRQDEIIIELLDIIPDPSFMNDLFQSDEFYDEDGNLDYRAVVDKGFNYDPKSNIIAL
ncbi:hypothetical protein [Pseudodesulfovibrio sp. zrk46]|uniref:hypothetical protein n=1 Tax=Pseudodesulfovibrio sp. zrk46 TaxID=2725288 RepID=UPI001448E17C|nr:hypothetical protein [Pseudodesulfovibrio sp. zrk46]QJB56883.1 hypothetical protein HFN16_10920 [Pseudodesulfovibrio sp. zrk46]